MLTIAYYFLQVILCSGILLGYYWLVLRNKKFHQYNRFYLLGIGLFSWLVPLIKINVEKPVQSATPQLFHLANIVAGNNSEIEHIVVQEGFVINWNIVTMALYSSVCALFLLWMMIGLLKVYKLLKSYSCKNLGDVYLIMTSNVKGTPFSFFKYIFWNDAIDVNTYTGQQMMQHELTHVREKHSIDKLFIQLVMMFGWFNPFFWLLKRELDLVHEFIADNKAIKNGDTSSLASMLLAAAYPNQQYLLANPFFFSPIKRRILMLTKTNNPRMSYARRVVVLPLLAVTVMLFAFRKKERSNIDNPLNKLYTVVIDAGHGGNDFGATAIDGTKEKDLALLILQSIKKINTNTNIKLVFTRENDVYQSPIEKAKFVNEQKADLFVSLHFNYNAENIEEQGFEINLPKNDGKRTALKQSESFAAQMEKSLSSSFKSNGIKTKQAGIWVLNATSCPAILLECGFISNSKDLALIKNESERKRIAERILNGISNYLKASETTKLTTDELLGQTKEVNSKPQSIGDSKTVFYKGQTIQSIIYTEDRYSHFVIKSSKDVWNINFDQLNAEMDKVEEQPRTASNNEKYSLLKDLYIACLRKKEEWELAKITGTRAKMNTLKTEAIEKSLSTAFANSDLMSTSTVNDLLLVDLIRRRNELIVKDKPANAQSIQFLNEKIALRVKDLRDGKPVLAVPVTEKVQQENIDAGIKYPLNNSYIKQKFGNGKQGPYETKNDGIVLCSKTDGHVKSITAGKVSFIGNLDDSFVVIVRSNDQFFSYSGMVDIKVQKGQSVSVGTFIGYASSDGNENEVTLMVADAKGKFVDPETLMATK